MEEKRRENCKLRSDVMKSGTDRALARLLMMAGGITKEQVKKPLIGVVNSYTNIFTGHAVLDKICRYVEDGILMAGGTPAVTNTIALCDGMCENTPGMLYPLPSRDIIADSVEAYVNGHSLDGLICIANCDKIVPGMLMAIMRLNIPAIFLSGGPSLPPDGGYDDATKFAKIMAATEDDIDAERNEIENSPMGPCGGCNSGMGTAVSMQIMSEVLGIGVLGNSTVPHFFTRRYNMGVWAGQRIVEMVYEDLKPSDIVSKESFKNCLRVDMMMGCSTNTTLHLPAIAAEAGYKITLEDFAKASRETPQIAKIYPSMSPHSMEDVRLAGGIEALLHQGIKGGYLNGDVNTIYGKPMCEMVAHAKVLNPEVIRPFDNPYTKEGGLAILKGSLAPDGCVIKTGGVLPEMYEHSGRAKVFDSEPECYKAIINGEIQPGDCVVIRYEGPAGGPGMREMLTITNIIRAKGLDRSVSLITDGRFSGGSVGGVIGHICPEAIKGGLIGLVEDGDIIEYSIPKGTIDLKVDEETLAKRREKWVCPPPRIRTGMLAQYAKLATSAVRGARMLGDPSIEEDLVSIDY
ncbi:dihydroxy-acid dehydratase [Faecalicatena acetigenes]|uniref:Dihydroxy-acid dehydratase n=1 Tax=Faecalicatena acetigenes TaxID=2981790 RepID=A0ABT2T815_9FIRM|nr:MULTISPECIES: dihydroxy-acid dehydratase [Lachnospiraceae]MCU6746395.1 dihydroxy-acid dehydratase [Faecalicatena acetigenes]SCH16119.1 Dihydroxy-acid dehydratase [uncultured Clostridium sp.]